jgi:DNA-binding CsgD family transcriptional regulator
MLLILSEREQSSVYRLLTATPEAGHDLLPPQAAAALVQLVPCDVLVVDELDRAGRLLGRCVWPARDHPAGATDPASVLTLTLAASYPRRIVTRLVRTRDPFEDRDVTMLYMLEPALAALMRDRPRLAPAPALSPAEKRVLELVAAGASNHDAAERLSVSVATVRKHLEHAYRKLGVTNRTAAVAALTADSGAAAESSPFG